jgi:hypothetical protein
LLTPAPVKAVGCCAQRMGEAALLSRFESSLPVAG